MQSDWQVTAQSGYHGFLAVDGRACAGGDHFVDALLVNSSVALCSRDEEEEQPVRQQFKDTT